MENEKKKCACGSTLYYAQCCAPFHQGKLAGTAEQLVRARFSAYALNIPSYIIATTHPASPLYSPHLEEWKKKISEFSRHVTFKNVEIVSHKDWKEMATVIFTAHISEKEHDLTFTEKSFFEKRKGVWFYRNGIIQEGNTPHFLTISETRILPLAYYGEPVLRKKAERIEEITPEIRLLAQEMIETMDAFDGAGLAAPQVHHAIRLFVMRVPQEPHADPKEVGAVKVFINPKLSSPSEEMAKGVEGCLSIPTLQGDVKRPKEITVEYTDLDGKQITRRVKGWEARVIMHETDHLNGVLYIDRMESRAREKCELLLKRLEERVHGGPQPL